jgi:creatinine amidohydrolase
MRAMQARYLATLTWPEAEQALYELPTVLLPLGASSKEHGPHLPLNNDQLIADYLARRVAEECAVLVLPTLAYAHYPAFLEYPGSVSIRSDACRDTIIDICQSLAVQGAKRFYVLNTGISTHKPLEAARKTIMARGSRMDFTNITTAYAALRRQVESQPGGTHADEIETSMMLYIAPDLVRFDRAVRDIHPEKGPGGLTRDPKAQTGVYSPTGTYGDPTLATVEKGKILVEGMVRYLIQQVQALSAEHVRRAPATLPSG